MEKESSRSRMIISVNGGDSPSEGVKVMEVVKVVKGEGGSDQE